MFLRRCFLLVAGVLLLAVAAFQTADAAKPNPQITVIPSTGLIDGSIVQVSGSGFQDQGIEVLECGGNDVTPPPTGAVCSAPGNIVTLHTNPDGSFGPVSFTVHTTIDGTKGAAGQHNAPATHDCAPTADCYIRAFSTSRGFRDATQDISFAP